MIATGLLAGAAGTLALDTYTYLDMAVRGRAASEVPSKVVQALANAAGVTSLAASEESSAKNRRSGLGALSGYGVGTGAGIAYAALRPACSWLPWPVAGLLLGAATLVVSEGFATKLGATDWSQWTPAEWLSDIAPRSLYGLTVAYAVEYLRER